MTGVQTCALPICQYLENKKDCKIKYSTTNELNADIIQIVGTLAGYKTNIQVREDLRKETFSDSFILSFNKNRETLPRPLYKSQ